MFQCLCICIFLLLIILLCSCFKWFMGSPRQLRRGSSCTVSGFKKFFRKVFLYFFNNCCSKKPSIFLLVGHEYPCFFWCRSLKGLSYARFGDVFTKYNPPTRNQNSFRFVNKGSYTFICLFRSFSTYQCMISCQLKFHAWFARVWRICWHTLSQMTAQVLHLNIYDILCET